MKEAEEYFGIDSNQIGESLQQFSKQFLDEKLKTKKWFGRSCNQFAIFGVDFVLDESRSLKILEFNAKPDIILDEQDMDYTSKLEMYKRLYFTVFEFNKKKYDNLLEKLLQIDSYKDLNFIMNYASTVNCNFFE